MADKDTAKLSTKAARRTRRFASAAARRASEDYTIPMNAMVPITSLPAKARDALSEQYPSDKDEFGKVVMVPDPRRGYTVRGRQLSVVLEKRREQTAKIEKKRKARTLHAALSPMQRRANREAGINHQTVVK